MRTLNIVIIQLKTVTIDILLVIGTVKILKKKKIQNMNKRMFLQLITLSLLEISFPLCI